MPSCEDCGLDFSREDSLRRHKNHHCKAGEICEPKLRRGITNTVTKLGNESFGDEIPTFDGDEFCGNKPKSLETLNKMMKLLKVPKHRWDKIGTSILNEESL